MNIKTLKTPTIFLIALALSLLISGCSKPPSILERIQQSKELVVITRNSPTTYYQDPDGQAGFEFDLAQLFADFLQVKLTIRTEDDVQDVINALNAGHGDLAAAGLIITETRKQWVRFGPIYQKAIPQLVYRSGTTPPDSIEKLQGKQIEVVPHSAQAELLRQLRFTYPLLTWTEQIGTTPDDLFYLVWEQVLDYTITNSQEFQSHQTLFPELRAGISLGEGDPVAWAFPYTTDTSLYDAAVQFFAQVKEDGRLAQLIDRYYSHLTDFDYVDAKRFIFHSKERLPQYEAMFQQAAGEVQMDWMLLAAMGYQESHWNNDSVSPTGVRGIMMLTEATASHLGVKNRLDPPSSIRGAAKYFYRLTRQIPDRIGEPDHTWLTLAAYNIGMRHLEDARHLTTELGGDADKWMDIKKYLPLLSQKKWYKKTKYGFARGHEAIQYVENVRGYYDHLQKLQNPQPAPDANPAPGLKTDEHPLL